MTQPKDESLSYAKGHYDSEHFPDRPSFAYVDKWASVFPDKEAYVFRPSQTQRDAITYNQLRNATEALAIWLKKNFGLRKGERVGILSLNRLEYVLCELAMSRLGVVSVRIYVTMDSKADLTRNLQTTECRLFLCQHASMKSVGEILPLETHDVAERLASPEFPKLEQVICIGGHSAGTVSLPDWPEIIISENEKLELYKIQSKIELEDDCSIYSTSGSTGLPKFVVHSYAGVMSFPAAIVRKCGITPDDRYFADRPLAHLGGNAMSVMTVGATMIIANPWITLAEDPCGYLITIMKEEKVTCGLSFPYLLYDIVKSGTAAAEFKTIKAKFFISAGQLVNAEIIGTVKNQLAAPIVNAYGSTEMGEVCCTSLEDDVKILSTYGGKVVAGAEVKIVNPETKKIVTRGEIGTLAIKRSHKWYYLNNPEKMEQCHDSDRFFYQGDMARMTDNGYIEIMGREDDMMSVGTVKIYPGPVELMLCRHPSVDKAIVFGVPDPRLYEVIGAVILPNKGVKVTDVEILKFFEDSVDKNDLMTGDAYVPKFVWIVTSFPLTSSGKVDKKTLRKQCLETLK